MKIITLNVILLKIFLIKIFTCQATPEISVNYIPKKQWKLSKRDLAEIKIDIEREVNNKTYKNNNN
jgi:hypothetical protein